MRTLVPAGAIAAAALLLAACTSGNTGGGVVTVTVPPSSTPAAPSSPAGNLSNSNSATPTPTSVATKLPGNCADVLSDYYVQQALGGTQLKGKDEFVVGVPDKTIGRTSTINCRYGVSGTAAKVEIGVSLYTTAAQATTRISATSSDYTAHGASAKDVTVTPQGQTAVNATYLSGGSGAGYTLPLLVVASDRRTVAVTVDPAAVTSPPAEQAAVAVAQVALQRTAV